MKKIFLILILFFSLKANQTFSQNQIETIYQVDECITGKWEYRNSDFKSIFYIYFDKSREKANGGKLFYKIDYGKTNQIIGEYRGVWESLPDVPNIKLKSFDRYYSWNVKLSNCARLVSNGTDIFIKISDENNAKKEVFRIDSINSLNQIRIGLRNSINLISREYACVTCHKFDAKLVGPSFLEIANKYKLADINYLINRTLKGGGKNVWGPIPKIASPYANKEEIRRLLENIFKIKDLN